MAKSTQHNAIIFLADEDKIDELLIQSESILKNAAKKVASGFIDAVTLGGPKNQAKMILAAAATVESIKKDGFNKQTADNIKNSINHIYSPSEVEVIQKKTLDEKLKDLKNILGIEYELIHIPFSDKNNLKFEPFGVLTKNGTFLRQLPSGRYCKLSQFQAFLAKEKYSAFKDITSALGAKTIKLMSMEVKEKNKTIKSKVTKDLIAGQIGIAHEIKEGTINGDLFAATFNPPTGKDFKIPSNYKSLVEQDSDLMYLINSRKNSNISKLEICSLKIESCEKFSQIVAKLGGKGFDIGGGVNYMYETTCSFQVEFW